MAPILPGITDRPEQLRRRRARRARGGRDRHLGERPLPPPGHEGALPRCARARTGPSSCRSTSGSTRAARTSRRATRQPGARAGARARAHARDPRPAANPARPAARARAACSWPSRPPLPDLRRWTIESADCEHHRDHLPDRRRPRGRPRRLAALALAGAAHPRDRRGVRRRERDRARRAARARTS